MAQLSYGVGVGPNGPQVMPIIIPDGPSAPESYQSYLETPEGVFVEITYHTSNKAAADRYSDELAQKSGWKTLQESPKAEESSLALEILAAWLFAFMGAFLLPMGLFIGASILHSARYLSSDWPNLFWGNGARIGVWTFIAMGFILTSVAISSHSSTKKHD